MKVMLKDLMLLAMWLAIVIFVWIVPAKGQVSSYPYSYDWNSAISMTGDGNYLVTSGTWALATYGSQCASTNANNLTLYAGADLDLKLNTSGISFTGGEEYSFNVAVSTAPSSSIASMRVQYSTNGGSTWSNMGSSVDLGNLSTGFSTITRTINSNVANKANARLKIRIFRFNAGTLPIVYVDNNAIGGGALPIQIASFAANVVRDNQVEVAWRTVSETNNYGFEIYRKRGDAGELAKVAFVQGHGTTLAPQSYTYVDAGLSFGKYYYQIKQIDLDGNSQTFPEMSVAVGLLPEKMVLAQNYPNPFNPSTLIEFAVPLSGRATVKVYSILGQQVATLFDGNAEAGKIYVARFDGLNLPSGAYFYSLSCAGKVETRRMLLAK